MALGNILLVSHGSPIAACHLALFRSWYYVGQCTIGKIIEENGRYTCEFFGSKEHLSDKTDLRDVQSTQENKKYKDQAINKK
uniref:DUF4258 domain-containing protein n=1 Tax=Heterorhabditis bacteriophora TaxID=37862 RepID=A0A1I7WRP0_HETBA